MRPSVHLRWCYAFQWIQTVFDLPKGGGPLGGAGPLQPGGGGGGLIPGGGGGIPGGGGPGGGAIPGGGGPGGAPPVVSK